ncbi:MAG: hypothetical protein WD895_09715 [Acidimicrobiia bacterium]
MPNDVEDSGCRVESNPEVSGVVGDLGADVVVEHVQNLVERLEHCYVGFHTPEQVGELHADHSAADNGQTSGRLLPAQGLDVGGREFDACDRWAGWAASGGDQNVVGSECFITCSNRVRVNQVRLGGHEAGAMGHKLFRFGICAAVDDLLCSLNGLLPIHRGRANIDSEFVQSPGEGEEFGDPDQSLFRYSTVVKSGAAEMVAFDEKDPPLEPQGSLRSGTAAGSTSDDDQVERVGGSHRCLPPVTGSRITDESLDLLVEIPIDCMV